MWPIKPLLDGESDKSMYCLLFYAQETHISGKYDAV